MHNAIVISTGLVAVVTLPQFEVLAIMAVIVVLAAAIIAVATRGRLGLKRSSVASAQAGACRSPHRGRADHLAMRFDLPGITGDFDANDLRQKGGRSVSTAGVGTSGSPTASAL